MLEPSAATRAAARGRHHRGTPGPVPPPPAGIFRHNLLGVEAVLRRGLVCAALTTLIVAGYLAVTVVAGTRLDRQALLAVLLAALIAVALMPVRGRVQSVALRAGARGYLLKDAERDDIVRAVLAVAAGEAVCGPSVAARIVGFFTGAHQRYASQLFSRAHTS